MKALLLEFRLGLGFLSLIPVGDVREGKLEKSLYTFPFVGLLIGSITVAVGFGAHYLLAPPLHVVAILISASILSGGLHLDGLADTFDGLCSWRSRSEKLKIMKDSRIGVMGALALIFVLLSKFVALSALGPYWWMAALLAPMWGRWAAFYNLHFFPRAEKQGLAAGISSGSRGQFIAATLFTLCITCFTLCRCEIPLAHQITLLLTLYLIIHFIAAKMSRSLGGVTGDTCGALSEMTELALLLALSSPLFPLA